MLSQCQKKVSTSYVSPSKIAVKSLKAPPMQSQGISICFIVVSHLPDVFEEPVVTKQALGIPVQWQSEAVLQGRLSG